MQGGVIITTHQIYFLDDGLKIIKKTNIKKFQQFGKIGFFGSLFIFEDTEAVYIDSALLSGHPKKIISKSLR